MQNHRVSILKVASRKHILLSLFFSKARQNIFSASAFAPAAHGEKNSGIVKLWSEIMRCVAEEKALSTCPLPVPSSAHNGNIYLVVIFNTLFFLALHATPKQFTFLKSSHTIKLRVTTVIKTQ